MTSNRPAPLAAALVALIVLSLTACDGATAPEHLAAAETHYAQGD